MEITKKIAMQCSENVCAVVRATVDEPHRARLPNEPCGTRIGRNTGEKISKKKITLGDSSGTLQNNLKKRFHFFLYGNTVFPLLSNTRKILQKNNQELCICYYLFLYDDKFNNSFKLITTDQTTTDVKFKMFIWELTGGEFKHGRPPPLPQ